jgi:hypothetical protein
MIMLGKEMTEKVIEDTRDQVTCLLGTFRNTVMGDNVNEEYLGILFDQDSMNWLMHGVFTHTDTLIPFHVWSFGDTLERDGSMFSKFCSAYGRRFRNSQASIEQIIRPETKENMELKRNRRRTDRLNNNNGCCSTTIPHINLQYEQQDPIGEWEAQEEAQAPQPAPAAGYNPLRHGYNQVMEGARLNGGALVFGDPQPVPDFHINLGEQEMPPGQYYEAIDRVAQNMAGQMDHEIVRNINLNEPIPVEIPEINPELANDIIDAWRAIPRPRHGR